MFLQVWEQVVEQINHESKQIKQIKYICFVHSLQSVIQVFSIDPSSVKVKVYYIFSLCLYLYKVTFLCLRL